MPTHTTPLASSRTLARTRVISGLELQRFALPTAANVRPTPEPGFYRDEQGTSIYYVAASGHAYLLRSPSCRALLVPADNADAIVLNGELLADEACDRELCLLAEAADALESERIEDGFYRHRGELYYVSLSRVFVMEQAADGPAWQAREVVDFPHQAQLLDDSERGALMLTLWAEARAVDRATGRLPRDLFDEDQAQA